MSDTTVTDMNRQAAMNTYAIALKRENPEVAERIQEQYPNAYQLTETFFLMQSDGIAKTVAVSAGIKGENRIKNASGVVFKLNRSYSGYTERALWDWLEQAQERESPVESSGLGTRP